MKMKVLIIVALIIVSEFSTVKAAGTVQSENKSTNEPIQLYVEILFVTHYSEFLRIKLTSDPDLVTAYVRFAYYDFFQKLKKSFDEINSGDFKLNLVLKDIIVQTVSSDWSQFINDDLDDDENNEDEPIHQLKEYVDGLNLTYKYDLVIGFANIGGIVGTPLEGVYYKIIDLTAWSFEDPAISPYDLYIMIKENLNENTEEIEKLEVKCSTDEDESTDFSPVYDFSNCEIDSMRNMFLNENRTAVADHAYFLANKPNDYTEMNTKYYYLNPTGVIFTPNDHCAFLYDETYKFIAYCPEEKEDPCSSISCYSSIKRSCHSYNGSRTFEKTICGPGKSCSFGYCVPDSSLSIDYCFDSTFKIPTFFQNNVLLIYNDYYKCNELRTHMNNKNLDIVYFCRFNEFCCETCKVYKSVECFDKSEACLISKKDCNGRFKTGEIVKDVCPYSCGSCEREPLTCTRYWYLCENGGICRDILVSPDEIVFFECECRWGYSGQLCQNKNPCLPNPCNSGKCVRFGSLSFFCVCNSTYDGRFCEIPSNGTGTVDLTTHMSSTKAIKKPTDQEKDYFLIIGLSLVSILIILSVWVIFGFRRKIRLLMKGKSKKRGNKTRNPEIPLQSPPPPPILVTEYKQAAEELNANYKHTYYEAVDIYYDEVYEAVDIYYDEVYEPIPSLKDYHDQVNEPIQQEAKEINSENK